MTDFLRKPEVLSPAGDIDRLRSALLFGADAVYLAGKQFGMRASANNFSFPELEQAVEIAHRKNARVYVTCNTVPRNEEIDKLPEFLAHCEGCGVDALIICDVGVLELAKKHAPRTAIHMSTQAGVANYATAKAFYDMGAQRVVLARELSLEEIAEIRARTPKQLEIEAFVHGSMCVSFSGRCLLSNYLTGRDSNRGDCAQPCRWSYYLCEETRKGEYFPLFEDERGTHILNSRDMCMIDHIPELLSAGVTSLKIEGRAKSSYYVSVITAAYRAAVDCCMRGEALPAWVVEECSKVSHREYSTGFYFGTEPGQVYDNGGYVRDYEVCAVVDRYEAPWLYCTQRNKFYRGDELDALPPGAKPVLIKADELEDMDGSALESAPHPMMKLRIRCDLPLPEGTLLRKAQ